jgi:hypothetical protein
MDQPTIYSEKVRETVKGRLAFGVRRSACGRSGSKPAQQICRKNNTVGAPSFSPYRLLPCNLQSLLALLIKDY